MLVATVTKGPVSLVQPKFYSVAFHLVLQDDGVTVIDQDFFVDFRTGDTIATKTAEIIEEMQAEINKYKAEQVIYDSAAFANAVTTVQNGLVL